MTINPHDRAVRRRNRHRLRLLAVLLTASGASVISSGAAMASTPPDRGAVGEACGYFWCEPELPPALR